MEGSKVINLELTVKSLFEQMKEHSYYLGEALKSDPKLTELAAKLQANDDDDTVLKDLAQEGGTKLGNILSRVIGKTSYSWDENTSVPLKFEISIFDTDYKCIIVVSKVNGLEFILCTSFLNLKIHVLQSIENQ